MINREKEEKERAEMKQEDVKKEIVFHKEEEYDTKFDIELLDKIRYDRVVDNNCEIIGKKYLSDGLSAVKELDIYNVNSKFIEDMVKYIKNSSRNTEEFARKIANVVVYTYDSIDDIVKSVSDILSYEKTNKDYVEQIENGFYNIPDILVNLSPQQKLESVLTTDKISIEIKTKIIKLINSLIEEYINEFLKSLYNYIYNEDNDQVVNFLFNIF
jgi:hypothetical protein